MSDPLSPKKRETLREKSDKTIKGIEDKDNALINCFDRLAKNPDGLYALQEIFRLSGANTSGLIMTGIHDVSANILFVKQGRSGLWQDLRKYFSRETLIAIEYPETKGQK